jgi:Zn finger protein HypA/HybF involved in hydrogenase expression
MHELSIALGILDVAGEEAQRHGGRVAAIHLKLGPLAGVVKERSRRLMSWRVRGLPWSSPT